MIKEEAIKVIKDNWPNDHVQLQEALETLIPELKENEDEKIRKAIKEAVENYWSDDTQARTDIFAWIEKQGEQKPTKVEPKFEVGDFIINEYGFIMQIDGIDSNMYSYHILDDNRILEYNITKTDESCHLWTIQYAKDGDMLTNDNSIIIFRKIGNDFWNYVIDFYIGYNCSSGKIKIQSGKLHYGNINETTFKPATKEQREFLLEKIVEAGYIWDVEKKELKKIEQKSTNKCEGCNNVKGCITCTNGDQWARIEEQNSSWSEEDKKNQ